MIWFQFSSVTVAVGLGIGFRGGVGAGEDIRKPCRVQVREDTAWTG